MRRTQAEGRVSEPAFPQLQPGPRTHQPLVFLLEDGTVLPQLPQGPQQLQTGPVLARERQAQGLRNPPDLVSERSPTMAPGDTQTGRLSPTSQAFRGSSGGPGEGLSSPPCLRGHPQSWDPLWSSPVLPIPAHLLQGNPMPTPPGPMVSGSPPPKSTPSISHPPQTLSSLAQLNTEPPPLNLLSLHSDSTI